MNKFARNDLLSLVNWGEAVFSLVWNKGKSHRGQGSHCSAISDIQLLAGAVWPHQGDNGQDGEPGKKPGFDIWSVRAFKLQYWVRRPRPGAGRGSRGEGRLYTQIFHTSCPTPNTQKQQVCTFSVSNTLLCYCLTCYYKWTLSVFFLTWSELGIVFIHINPSGEKS